MLTDVDLRGLQPRHQKFLLELVRDWNATGAYRRAGYRAAGHAAEVNASRLLKRPDVVQAYQAIVACEGGQVRLQTARLG